jgi:hypothetical protein
MLVGLCSHNVYAVFVPLEGKSEVPAGFSTSLKCHILRRFGQQFWSVQVRLQKYRRLIG